MIVLKKLHQGDSNMQPKLRTSGYISILEILGCEERFPLWAESDISLIASLVECLFFFSSGTLLEEAVEPVGDVACLTEADLRSFTCLTGSGLHSVPRLSALCGLPYFPCQNEPASLPLRLLSLKCETKQIFSL